jgi:hypothetical protein
MQTSASRIEGPVAQPPTDGVAASKAADQVAQAAINVRQDLELGMSSASQVGVLEVGREVSMNDRAKRLVKMVDSVRRRCIGELRAREMDVASRAETIQLLADIEAEAHVLREDFARQEYAHSAGRNCCTCGGALTSVCFVGGRCADPVNRVIRCHSFDYESEPRCRSAILMSV